MQIFMLRCATFSNHLHSFESLPNSESFASFLHLSSLFRCCLQYLSLAFARCASGFLDVYCLFDFIWIYLKLFGFSSQVCFALLRSNVLLSTRVFPPWRHKGIFSAFSFAIFSTRVRLWQWDPLASLTIQVCLAESLWLRPRRVEVSERHGKASKDMARTHGSLWTMGPAQERLCMGQLWSNQHDFNRFSGIVQNLSRLLDRTAHDCTVCCKLWL